MFSHALFMAFHYVCGILISHEFVKYSFKENVFRHIDIRETYYQFSPAYLYSAYYDLRLLLIKPQEYTLRKIDTGTAVGT